MSVGERGGLQPLSERGKGTFTLRTPPFPFLAQHPVIYQLKTHKLERAAKSQGFESEKSFRTRCAPPKDDLQKEF